MIDQTTEQDVITFGYIPKLGPGPGTLMPRTGGLAGVEYAQICTQHMIKAKREGWGPIVDAEPYIVSGPDGEAEVVLLCKGEPIRGASSLGGAQMCYIDRDIYTLTGFDDPDGKPTEDPASESTSGPDNIQARQPSV